MQAQRWSVEHLGLPQRWHARAQYTVLDSSFGDGLHFLQLWDVWRKDCARPDRLHIVSLSPSLPKAAVLREQLLACVSADLHPLVEQLVQAWPLNLPGTHRLDFEGLAVTLTLAVGPLERTVPRLAVLADAIIFSDMQAIRLEDLAPVWRLTLPGLVGDPHHTLLASRGGRVAWELPQMPQMPQMPIAPPCLTDRLLRRPRSTTQQARQAIVVGAGVAGAGVAQALALRGWQVQVIDSREKRRLAHGAHLAAALTPMVTRDDDVRARLSRAGSLRAQARWAHVSQEALWRCGALQLQRVSGRIVDLKAVLEGLALPAEWVRYVEAGQASDIAGLPLSRGGLYFPTAARIAPERLLNELLATSGVAFLDAQVHALQRTGAQWQVLDASGRKLAEAPQLIIAGAQGTQALLRRHDLLEQAPRLAAMHPLGGEITQLPADLLAGGPRCIVSGDGYILPALNGQCVVGSSYVHGAEQIGTSLEGVRDNLQRAKGLLGSVLHQDCFREDLSREIAGWAGWRAVLPGRLPAIGPLAHVEDLWVVTGLASRGLTWASLAGDLIAAALNHEPLPLERDIIDKISQT